MYWINQHYQKSDSPERVAEALAWHFEQQGIDITQGPALVDLVAVQAERCKTLVELCKMSAYFYTDDIEYDEAAVKKHLRPVTLDPLMALHARLKELTSWDRDALQTCINDVSAAFDINMSKIAQPLRVAVTGTSMSPSIDLTLTLLGKARVLSRLEMALGWIAERKEQSC